jgi:DTW domain-containing protein YfiP
VKHILYILFGGIALCGFPLIVAHFMARYCRNCGQKGDDCICPLVNDAFFHQEEL